MYKNIVICVKCGTEFLMGNFEFVNVHVNIILKRNFKERRWEGVDRFIFSQ